MSKFFDRLKTKTWFWFIILIIGGITISLGIIFIINFPILLGLFALGFVIIVTYWSAEDMARKYRK